MYQKIKTKTKKLGKTAIIAITAMLIAGVVNAQEKMKIAVLDLKASVGINQSDVDGISAILITYLNDVSKFSIVERLQIDKVINELGFPKTQLNRNQMIKIGEKLKVCKIVIGDINIISGQYNIDVRVVDVQTGETDATAGETWVQGTSYREVMKKLAQTLSSKIKITGDCISSKVEENADIVKIMGFLYVFPEDLGAFSSEPYNIIYAINKNKTYGYDDWRLPTIEELQLIRANSKVEGIQRYGGGSCSNEFYYSCDDVYLEMIRGIESRSTTYCGKTNSANVRLVRTPEEYTTNPQAQLDLGLSYNKAEDYTKAAKWYKKSAEKGNADAQVMIGDLYWYGAGVTQSEEQAIEWWKRAAKQGQKHAIEELRKRGITY